MALTAETEQELHDLVDKKYAFIDRTWDIVFWVTASFVVAGAADITKIVFAGDWDFWMDWRDRQFWMAITPFATIIIPSTIQFIQWRAFRFPTGATYTATTLFLAAWIGRWHGWDLWMNYPLSFVWPITVVPAAVLMDWILLKSKSFIVTALAGSFVWTGALWVGNYSMLAPYLQPVRFMGNILTVADLQGVAYLRAQTPEYLRIIEQGSLRTFLGETALVSLVFGATVAIAGYGIGQLIGRFLAVWPILRFMKQN